MTSIESATFTFGTLVQLIGYVLGLSILYFKMKGRMDKIETCVKSYVKQNDLDKKKTTTDIEELEESLSETQTTIFEKIDGLKDMMHNNHVKLLEAINAGKTKN